MVVSAYRAERGQCRSSGGKEERERERERERDSEAECTWRREEEEKAKACISCGVSLDVPTSDIAHAKSCRHDVADDLTPVIVVAH